VVEALGTIDPTSNGEDGPRYVVSDGYVTLLINKYMSHRTC